MQEIREGKEGYGDPSGEATEEARPRKQADCMVSQVCCSGCVEVAPHNTVAVLVMETNHRKEGRQSSSTHVPAGESETVTEAADGHGYRALLWPATINLVACPYMGGCFQTKRGRPGCHPRPGRRFLKR
jgi:hypothetical protein